MEWLQVVTIVGANLAAFIWARQEAANDRRQMQATIDAIHQEMKDFHGRLCAIEERRRR